MKRKVCLVTRSGRNFGAVLQAYALNRILKEEGAEVLCLNYPYSSLNSAFQTFKKVKSYHELYYNLKTFPYRKSIELSNKRFLRFREALTFSAPYFTWKEVQENPPVCDIAIAGSDQVWNPIIRFSPVDFLAWGKSSMMRASYSASIGIEHIPDNLKESYRTYLSRFNHISVRETSAEKELAEIGIPSITTLDPTLLLDAREWTAACNTRTEISEPYILIYQLYEDPRLGKIACQARKELNCKVVNLSLDPRISHFGDRIIYDAGPAEFVSYVRNARFVLTSSYHGMLFSINFGTPFAVVSHAHTALRMKDILDRLHMGGRIIEREDQLFECYTLTRNRYESILDEERSKSRNYIRALLTKNR